MRRAIILAAALGAVWGCALPWRVQAQELDRLAFIDMERVFAEYHKTKRADARLKDQAEAFNDERNTQIQELRDLEEVFNETRAEAQDETLNEDARNRKRTEAEEKLVELREKERAIRAFEETGRKQLEEQGLRMRKRIVDEITVLLESYASGRNLFAVIDSSGPSLNQVPVFLYREASHDITDEILAKLNADAEQEQPAAVETSGTDEATE